MTIDYSKYEGCTEGPWFGGADCKTIKIDGAFIYEYNADTIHNIGKALPVRHASNKGRSERLANARLMADAPLLLAHCKKRDEEVERLREQNKVFKHALEEAYDKLWILNVCSKKSFKQDVLDGMDIATDPDKYIIHKNLSGVISATDCALPIVIKALEINHE